MTALPPDPGKLFEKFLKDIPPEYEQLAREFKKFSEKLDELDDLMKRFKALPISPSNPDYETIMVMLKNPDMLNHIRKKIESLEARYA